ncbi:hypothetical protein, partial [Escherichia coli]|uniref:hypothetical protein n=1 Tax=Escherichia coli TaxID=562 RepID=UPI0012FFDC17
GCAVRLPMPRVVESDVKTSQARKRFDARRRVANLADRMLIAGGKLLFVAARARKMSGHSRLRRIVFALVAEQTRQPLMLRL